MITYLQQSGILASYGYTFGQAFFLWLVFFAICVAITIPSLSSLNKASNTPRHPHGFLASLCFLALAICAIVYACFLVYCFAEAFKADIAKTSESRRILSMLFVATSCYFGAVFFFGMIAGAIRK